MQNAEKKEYAEELRNTKFPDFQVCDDISENVGDSRIFPRISIPWFLTKEGRSMNRSSWRTRSLLISGALSFFVLCHCVWSDDKKNSTQSEEANPQIRNALLKEKTQPALPNASNDNIVQVQAQDMGAGVTPMVPPPVVSDSGAAGITPFVPPPSPSSQGVRVDPAQQVAGAVNVNPGAAAPRAALDVGDLLGKSEEAIGVDLQRRTSVVSDPRVRGYHVGQVATWSDGGFFFPARQDLDTAVSKYDASIIRDVLIFKGPYSVSHGPAFAILDVATLDALPWEPRYQCGTEYHGKTILGYQSNGQKFDGLQSLWGGNNDWGFRVSYGIRVGNDYEAGNDYRVSSNYNSQPINYAFGLRLSENSKIEIKGLHLDLRDVDFAGLYFDIRHLQTDAGSVRYELKDQEAFDRLVIDAWYNRTRATGDTTETQKQIFLQTLLSSSFDISQPPQMPPQQIKDNSNTDFLEQSRGYRAALTWGQPGHTQFSVGSDLNYVSQKLDENIMYNSVDGTPVPLFFGNSMGMQFLSIPSSHLADPGIFLDAFSPVGDRFSFKTGARFDWVETNSAPRLITGNIPLFFNQGVIRQIQTGFDPIIFSQQPNNHELRNEYFLWSAFISMDYKINEHWLVLGSFGYSERPPTLTELYAAGPWISVLQQGLNRLYGDPHLRPEKLKQLEFGLRGRYDCLRTGITGFYAFVNDYITYDQVSQLTTSTGSVSQVVFTNTNFATLAGGEIYLELDLTPWLTPFGNLTYVEGRDRSHTSNVFPDTRFTTSRQTVAEEPLPGIPPLEGRVGLRIHEPIYGTRKQPRWSIEGAVRLVKTQDLVATSLGEQPTPGFVTYDIRGYWQVLEAGPTISLRNPSVLLTAGVENIGNKFYREHLDPRAGFPTDLLFRPGTNAHVGAQIEY